MTIYARYMGELVEVTAVWESARRKVASIRTVSDFRKPFTLWSMGGLRRLSKPNQKRTLTAPLLALKTPRQSQSTWFSPPRSLKPVWIICALS